MDEPGRGPINTTFSLFSGMLILANGRRYWQRLEAESGQLFFSLVPADGVGPTVLVQGPASMSVEAMLARARLQLGGVG